MVLIFSFILKSYPKRLIRFLRHPFQYFRPFNGQHLKSNGWKEWLGDFVFYAIDLFMLPDLFEFLFVLFQTRTLTKIEIEEAKKYFSNAIDFRYVRLNENMSRFFQKFAHAFVTFNIIHYSKSVSKPILMHELVHVWQYQRFGSVYIYRALKAQQSEEKYNYGGPENLYHSMLKSDKFIDFNFEQQGEIIEDYCRLVENKSIFYNTMIDAVYSYYADQLD